MGEEIARLNRTVFGNLNGFRPLQREAIEAILQGRDVFLVLPTGAGKSLCFQLPAILGSGVTIVVCPLVSLIIDQTIQLAQMGIAAASLLASQSTEENDQVFKDLYAGRLALLYVTPERLHQSKRLVSTLKSMETRGRLERFVIDEAHCVSEWGHDFRTDYAKLKSLRSVDFCTTPIVAITATASLQLQNDVLNTLGMNVARTIVLRGGINRPNIAYRVIKKVKGKIISQIAELIEEMGGSKMSGLVYCTSRKDTEIVADGLRKFGIEADAYHADLSSEHRDSVQVKWCEGEIKVIVATVAFGMGINKKDVRYVIHHSLPKSIEGFYQESGRAGRDGKPCTAIVCYDYNDKSRNDLMIKGNVRATRSLLQMVNWCENKSTCKRIMLSEAFGEQKRGSCEGHEEACQVCTEGVVWVAQPCKNEAVALYCLCEEASKVRVPGLTISGLRDAALGSQSVKLPAWRNLPNFGCLVRLGKSWTSCQATSFLRLLVINGVLVETAQAVGDYGGIASYVRPAPAGMLRCEGVVFHISQVVKKKVSKVIEKVEATPDIGSHSLAQSLRDTRRTLASVLRIGPATTIFDDNVLLEISQKRPTTISALADIQGLGEFKIEKYGQQIIDCVIDFLASRGVYDSVVSVKAMTPMKRLCEDVINSKTPKTSRYASTFAGLL